MEATAEAGESAGEQDDGPGAHDGWSLDEKGEAQHPAADKEQHKDHVHSAYDVDGEEPAAGDGVDSHDRGADGEAAAEGEGEANGAGGHPAGSGGGVEAVDETPEMSGAAAAVPPLVRLDLAELLGLGILASRC